MGVHESNLKFERYEHNNDFFIAEATSFVTETYCRGGSVTTESISSLQSQSLYYIVDFLTTEWISRLRSRFLYYGSDVFTTESTSSAQSQSLYYIVDFFTAELTFCLLSDGKACQK